METSSVQRALRVAGGLREQQGLLRAAGMLILRVLARVTGGTVLACMHKPVGHLAPSAARLLTRREIERASGDARLDLPPEFVASQDSRCYGVVEDERVRCYAWAASKTIRAVPGSAVTMPPEATYIFKVFTDPSFRRRGLLRECLKAIEQAAVREGHNELTALVEVHNPGSLQAFRSAGFERCGFVAVLRSPWAVKRIGCTASVPCAWCKLVA